jgi:hypothetical protein
MKNQIVVAIKNQFAVVLIVGGGIIIAPAVFIVALVRLARINVSLAREIRKSFKG